MLDLERLFCEHVCFFDPEKYENCSNEHTGNIAIFCNSQYQQIFDGFEEEIEKYPEFQDDKLFDFDVLENTRIIEHNLTAVREMNRLLKIVLSLLTVQKTNIRKKINE